MLSGSQYISWRCEISRETCNVENKEKLKKYREKWKEWMSWYVLSEDEPNSIQQQLDNMFSHDLLFRALMDARSKVAENIEVAAHAPILIYLLNSGYITNQVMMISKLLENNGRGQRPSDVISVRRLLEDIKKNKDIITREVYVSEAVLPDQQRSVKVICSGGYTMDKETASKLHEQHLLELFHKRFDKLSGKQEDNRSKDDTIRMEIFEDLGNRLTIIPIQKLKASRNKFIAHAADKSSREREQKPIKRSISYDQVDEAQRAIIYVERTIIDIILSLNIGRDVVSGFPDEYFHGLNLLYADKQASRNIRIHIDELTKKRNKWTNMVSKKWDI